MERFDSRTKVLGTVANTGPFCEGRRTRAFLWGGVPAPDAAWITGDFVHRNIICCIAHMRDRFATEFSDAMTQSPPELQVDSVKER